MRVNLRRIFCVALIGVAAIFHRPIGDCMLFLNDVVFHDNFHEVSAGRFYRSAQMSAERLARTLGTYRIKTVIDIRAGKATEEKYGFSEAAVVERAGGRYIHVPLIGARLPTRGEIKALIDAYDSAEEPILVHDSSGTHRAGTASAIWLLIRGKLEPQKAESQLAVRYGFFRTERAIKSWLQGQPTIDYLIWKFAAEHARSGLDFREWVRTTKDLQSTEAQ